MKLTLALISLLLLGGCANSDTDTTPTSLVHKTVPAPVIKQWQDYKYGMFVHWGPYAVAAGSWQGKSIEKLGEQIQRHADISPADYDALAKTFQPANFNADQLVSLATNNQMNYMVFTAKHHDGFAMFDTKYSSFDIVEHGGFGRDIVAELSAASQRANLPLGLYYSTPDWHFARPQPERNPVDGKLSVFAKVDSLQQEFQLAQLNELMTQYGPLVELFFDMGEPTPEQSSAFREAVKAHQPNTLINSRIMNYQGDILTLPDNHLPQQPVLDYPWESPSSFHHTWGFKNTIPIMDDEQQIQRQIKRLSAITSLGGNFLLNVGPDKNGQVPAYEMRGIEGINDWLTVHGEAIFKANPINIPQPAWGYLSQSGNALYLHIHRWPKNNELVLAEVKGSLGTAVALHATTRPLPTIVKDNRVIVDLTDVTPQKYMTVIKIATNNNVSVNLPAISPEQSGAFSLSDTNGQRGHSIDAISYRSLLIDRSRWWHLNLPSPQCYNVTIDYVMPYAEKHFSLTTPSSQQALILNGKNSKQAYQHDSMDGNESNTGAININGNWQYRSTAPLCFADAGKQRLSLSPGKAFSDQATQTAFRAQNTTYRSLKLKIKALRLTPVD